MAMERVRLNKIAATASNVDKVEILRPVKEGFAFLARPQLLQTENSQDFDDLRKAIQRDIKPEGIIEEFYVFEIACLMWDTLRLRRCKAATINSAYPRALKSLLKELSGTPEGVPDMLLSPEEMAKHKARYQDDISDDDREIEDLAFDWFGSEKAQLRVSKLLRDFSLDESAIEARAIRLVSDDLNRLETMLMSLEARRDKLLRRIGEYREIFGKRLRASSDEIIAHDVPALQRGSTKESAA